jgi:hypothetical protein
VPTQIAKWNPARDVWETDQTGLICEHLAAYSETWPTAGTTRNGVAYMRPPLVLRIPVSGSSSLLGTPRTSSANGVGQYQDSERGTRGRLEAQVDLLLKTPTSQLAENGGSQHPDHRKAGGHGPTLADEVEHLIPVKALPTPTARDYKGQNQRGDASCLPGALLPTPRASDGEKGGPNQRGSSGDLMLPSAVVRLIPTPTAMDSHSSGTNKPTSKTLTDAAVREQFGARTNPRFVDGSLSPESRPPHQQNSLFEEDSA